MISWFVKENKFNEEEGGVTSPLGYLTSAVKAGLKKKDYDLGLLVSEEPADVVGVFTTNNIKAAPVLLSQKNIKNKIKGILINSKYANSFTGIQGKKDALKILKNLAKQMKLPENQFLMASTGVIGERLPVDKIIKALPAVVKLLEPDDQNITKAIMTTDTRPKKIAVTFKVGSKNIHIGAMAKGAGMIAPNLATMLAFITTDISISKILMRKALKEAVAVSFNKITIDGDISTNDSVYLMTNHSANNLEITAENVQYKIFKNALTYVCQQLAYKIVSDGEGATKLIDITVKGAHSTSDASKVVRTIAQSLLVKTAMFGEDLNWGRVVNAIGYSGAKINPDTIDIKCNTIPILRKSSVLKDNLKKAQKYLKYNSITFDIHLHMGNYEDYILTTDLSLDYIKINAEYRS